MVEDRHFRPIGGDDRVLVAIAILILELLQLKAGYWVSKRECQIEKWGKIVSQ